MRPVPGSAVDPSPAVLSQREVPAPAPGDPTDPTKGRPNVWELLVMAASIFGFVLGSALVLELIALAALRIRAELRLEKALAQAERDNDLDNFPGV